MKPRIVVTKRVFNPYNPHIFRNAKGFYHTAHQQHLQSKIGRKAAFCSPSVQIDVSQFCVHLTTVGHF